MEKKENYLNRRQFVTKSGKSILGLYLSASFLLSSCNGCKNKNKSKILRLQLPWINDAEFIGYFVAIENGYYKDEGIDFTYLPGGPEIVSDSVLVAKNAEIALTTPDVTINSMIKEGYKFKIIGTQYQKSPLGIVSLEKNNIKKPTDLVGKTLAVPPANQLTIDAFLKINNIDKKDVRIVPYQYDPGPLLKDEVDATLDFVTNVPFTITEKGGIPTSFLLYDYGFQIFNDTIVVREDTLEDNKELLKKWLKASKKGWEENFKNPEKYTKLFINSHFKGTGRTEANETFYNKAQQPLMETTAGIFSMSEDAINNNIKSLAAVGINAKREMFVNDLI
jgi:ABC-type nitrate/sulfonate/bicarbonate transport system substrate-binding protein